MCSSRAARASGPAKLRSPASNNAPYKPPQCSLRVPLVLLSVKKSNLYNNIFLLTTCRQVQRSNIRRAQQRETIVGVLQRRQPWVGLLLY